MPDEITPPSRERVVERLRALEGDDRRYEAIREAIAAAAEQPLPMRMRFELAARLRIDPERIRIEEGDEALLTVRIQGDLGRALNLESELGALFPRDRRVVLEASRAE